MRPPRAGMHTRRSALTSQYERNEFQKYLWKHLLSYRQNRLKTYSCDPFFFWFGPGRTQDCLDEQNKIQTFVVGFFLDFRPRDQLHQTRAVILSKIMIFSRPQLSCGPYSCKKPFSSNRQIFFSKVIFEVKKENRGQQLKE